MKKLLYSVLSLSVAGLLAAGCGLLGPEEENEDDADITIDPIGNVQAGQGKVIEGQVSANVEVDKITYTILDGEGNELASDAKVRTNTPNSMIGNEKFDIKDDADLRIVSDATACNGTYSLKIEVTAGSFTGSDTEPFTIVNGSDCDEPQTSITTNEVTLGSWKSSIGSYLDADDMTVYEADNVGASTEGDIDVVFSNQQGGGAWLMNVKVAAGQQLPAKDWSTQNENKMMEVSGVDYTTLTSQDDIDALWSSSNASTFVDIDQGDVIIVNTNKGTKRLLVIKSVEKTDAGTCVIIGVMETTS